MNTTRLEAFSDGVIAIIITIMVLELKVPHEESLAALVPVLPVFLSYVLSFVYVGIYWNNHHHMLHACGTVTGRILWANQSIIAAQGSGSLLKQAVGGDWKGKLSPALYAPGIAAAFRAPPVSQIIYALVAVMWLVPDRRVEHALAEEEK